IKVVLQEKDIKKLRSGNWQMKNMWFGHRHQHVDGSTLLITRVRLTS
nr:hypothetical protein [Tanacetum cinerariifolium]